MSLIYFLNIRRKCHRSFLRVFSYLLCGLNLFLYFVNVKAQNVNCEKVENFDWSAGDLKTCYMTTTTSIGSSGISISAARDETVGAINFASNKNIHFLPENPAGSFPKLIAYSAASCAVERISKSNFQNLETLQNLFLFNNKLTRIETNTFEDLHSLTRLDLGKETVN